MPPKYVKGSTRSREIEEGKQPEPQSSRSILRNITKAEVPSGAAPPPTDATKMQNLLNQMCDKALAENRQPQPEVPPDPSRLLNSDSAPNSPKGPPSRFVETDSRIF